jgi:3-oxoacyl-[acyl-carrier protein] reductase
VEHVAQELAGKTALVTGAGRNIGRAVALELATKGARVVVNTRSNQAEAEAVAAEVRELGSDAVVVVGDVASPATIDALKTRAEDAFGRVDILVSNAALRPYQSLLDTTDEDWSHILDIQLNASFRLARAFVPGMRDAGWGRIIHITGPDAFTGESNRAHVVAAKGGLRGLTKALAIELGPYGITVNDVAPGVLDTERNDASHPAVSAGAPDDTDRRGYIPEIPVGRLGTSEDVAYACGFLASPRAGYYTGIVLPCFGGYVNPG